MKKNLSIILFHFFILKVNSNLYLTMEIVSVDDCVTKIYFENNTKIYENKEYNTICDSGNSIKDNPVVENLPYEIGQKIFVEVKDNVAGCGLSITLYLNEYRIKTESKKFWTCINCEGNGNNNYVYNNDLQRLDCINYFRHEYYAKYFIYYFQINSLTEIIN